MSVFDRFNYEAEDFRVLVGGHSRNSTENVSLMELERIFVHENYTGRSTQWNNDLALLKVKKDIQFNIFAQPICLTRSEVQDGSPLVATGWGKTGGRSIRMLSKTNLQTLSTLMNASA